MLPRFTEKHDFSPVFTKIYSIHMYRFKSDLRQVGEGDVFAFVWLPILRAGRL